jgi:hypothetical protein
MQACLYINCNEGYNAVIRARVSPEMWHKLQAVARSCKRPGDFPRDPHVAVITGALANRGITFRSAECGLVASAVAFGHKGAGSAGPMRVMNLMFCGACGKLKQLVELSPPVIIAPKNTLRNAATNKQ